MTKRVDIPEKCNDCDYACSDNKNWYCELNDKDNDDYVLRGTQPKWCPIQTMTPAEAKDIINRMYKGYPTTIQKKALELAYSALDNMSKCGECSRRKWYQIGYRDGVTDGKYKIDLSDSEIRTVMDALSGTPVCTTAEFVDKIEKILRRDINKWIPVKELPKEKGWYLCTCSDKEIWGKDIVRDLYYYPELKQFVDNIRYEVNELKDMEKFYWTKYVTAWKPLPEPYEGGEE